jgi:hypothetical protein
VLTGLLDLPNEEKGKKEKMQDMYVFVYATSRAKEKKYNIHYSHSNNRLNIHTHISKNEFTKVYKWNEIVSKKINKKFI